MQRIPEPELMEEREQAAAYAAADFEEPHNRVVDLFDHYFPYRPVRGILLDLGCGPGDICFRMARRFPALRVHGIDGSDPMLDLARKRLQQEPELGTRLRFSRARIGDFQAAAERPDAILCTSLLHHLHRPQELWNAVNRLAAEKTFIFVVDLFRPAFPEKARWIVEHYSGNEPDVLKRDFYNSLLAAFTPSEVEEQLAAAGLSGLTVKTISDRHLLVYGCKAPALPFSASPSAISSSS